MLVLAFFVLAVCAWLACNDFAYPVWYRLRARRHRCGAPPLLWFWPLGIPFVRDMMKAAESEKLLKLTQDHYFLVPKNRKTFMRQGLLNWVLSTRDPENIKAILATQFAEFSLGARTFQFEPVFGSGIFTQNGMQWKHSRAMLRPQFSKERISHLDSVERHVETLIAQVSGGKRVEMQNLFHLFTMDTATEFLFGESVQSLQFSNSSRGTLVVDAVSNEQVWSADFVESYTWLNQLAFKRCLLNGLSWITHWTDPKAKFHLRRVHIFLDYYVRLALQATEDMPADTSNEASKYVFSRELARQTRDPVLLRDQLFNILIAGRDTTASTLSFALFYLARYPREWEKVRTEVLALLPPGTTITYENLRRLQYTQFFIKEVLRLAPVVPLNVRTAIRDTMLPFGGGSDGSQPVFVPRGAEVEYAPYVLHRDKSIYGSDAEEFRPERWLPENREKNSFMNSWGYIPFNGGPRICLGQQFALNEITITLVKLTQSFTSVEPAEGFPDQQSNRAFLTLQVGSAGVPVKFN